MRTSHRSLTATPDPTDIKAGIYDSSLEALRQTVVNSVMEVHATAKAEGRSDLLASEARAVEAANKILSVIDGREEVVAANFAQQRADQERRESESAALRNALPGVFGPATTGQSDSTSVGATLAKAIEEVRSGRSASASVPLEVRNLVESGAWGGAVPIEMGDVQRTLRARSVVMSLPGVRTVPMASDTLRYPRIGESEATGVVEAQAFDSNDPDLDTVTLTAVKFGVLTQLSEELEQDFSADALDVLASNMLSELALKVDHELLEGTGSGPGLVGIRNWPGINTTAVDGVPADFDEFREVEYELAAANADTDNAQWLMHPRSWFVLGKIVTGLASDKTTLLQADPQQGARTLLGYPVRRSNQITLTEGAGAGSWAGLIDGSQLVIGERLSARVEVSRDFAFDQDLITLRAKCRVGFAIINPGAVSIATDIRAS